MRLAAGQGEEANCRLLHLLHSPKFHAEVLESFTSISDCQGAGEKISERDVSMNVPKRHFQQFQEKPRVTRNMDLYFSCRMR